MLEPHARQVLAGNGKMYTATGRNEKMAIKLTKKEELNGDIWESLKHKIEAEAVPNKDFSSNWLLKTCLRGYFSDTASYWKRIVRNYGFNITNYNLLIFKIGARLTADVDLRKKQLNTQEELKIIVKVTGNQQIDISW